MRRDACEPRGRRKRTSTDARTDADLITAMRYNDATAWAAFDARFRPVLEAYARKANSPRCEWPVCISELLTDEALRLTERRTEVPRSLSAYLVRASRNRFLYTKRSMTCRDRNYVAASEHRLGEWVVPSTCSDHARRASEGPDVAPFEISNGLRRLADHLQALVTDEERAILGWVAEGVPRRTIATWLGASHEACAKRIWRLCHRLRLAAIEQTKRWPASERREIDRFFARAKRGASRRTTRGAPTRSMR
jgi:hypothetical protein